MSSQNRGSGPGYTVADLVWYSGLIAGMVGTYFALMPLGVQKWVSLVAGLVVGIGLGWLGETIYRQSKRRRPPDRQDGPPQR
jgi:hypothetical protein